MVNLRSRFIRSLFLLLALALIPSCGGSSDEIGYNYIGYFVVRFDPIGGGCWNLVAQDNSIYGPISLDNVYRIDGLRVYASLLRLNNFLVICDGVPVAINMIEPAP